MPLDASANQRHKGEVLLGTRMDPGTNHDRTDAFHASRQDGAGGFPSASAAWACPASMESPTTTRASQPSAPPSSAASRCSTPATSTAWATTSFWCAAASRACATGFRSRSSSARCAGLTARGWGSIHAPPPLTDALGALAKPLSQADVAAVEMLVAKDSIAGTRYPAEQMKHLDSER